MRIITAINLHKALVIPVVLGLMWWHDDWRTEAFVYLALHGTYSLLWIVKSKTYPDRRFEEVKPVAIAVLFVFLPLAGYYVAPYLLTARQVDLPPPVLGLVLVSYIVGLFLHFVADAQKHYILALRPGLVTEGLMSRTRNPNYLGEILIYLAFATLAWHWLPIAILACWVFGFFVPNMVKKDRSLSRYPEFAAYRRRTGLLWPKLLGRPTATARASEPAEQSRSDSEGPTLV